jgi:hypothetical protein
MKKIVLFMVLVIFLVVGTLFMTACSKLDTQKFILETSKNFGTFFEKLFPKIDTPKLILGSSKIVVPNGAIVGTQVDRVIRDIVWEDSQWDKSVPENRVPTKPEDIVPYMEGARVRELMSYAGVNILPLANGIAKFNSDENSWYASDAMGNWRFEIDPSKIDYETAKKTAEDTVVLPDTHGFNIIANLAMNANPKPFLVVACMDLHSKTEAALYLAQNGINIYGPCDRFAGELIGYQKTYPDAATIIGTAPIKKGPNETAIIGDQPIEIDLGETIIVQTATDLSYPWQYADTPMRYLASLAEKYPETGFNLISVDANAGYLERVINKAKELNAEVVAVRVGKSNSEEEAVHDAKILADWLSESKTHRAILFHTAIYEPGYSLFFDFPKQTTFGDLNPVIKQ